MKKKVGAALRRGLFCALFVMLSGTVAFAAETAKEAENKLQQDFDNLNNQYLRLAADFDNYRKEQPY